jgi:hypothetical protein
MYAGEMLTKTICAGLIASIKEERETHRYRQAYRLVRANGIGEWADSIIDITQGTANQFLHPSVRTELIHLTQKNAKGTWQYDSLHLLHGCLEHATRSKDKLPTKVAFNQWFPMFSELRNKTRGHGATYAEDHRRMYKPLEESIGLIIENFSLLARPWAYLQEQLSGVYRVTSWTMSAKYNNFYERLRQERLSNQIQEGVYIFWGDEDTNSQEDLAYVELIVSDIDARDYYYPNGGWDGKQYELMSYITNDRKHADATPYLRPTTNLPPSETQGLSDLEARGESFSTLPQKPDDYVTRVDLESKLREELLEHEYHRIITLVGRGGIGKTSLALSVLHDVSSTRRFDAILWFSARDIDLMEGGAKPVRAHVLTVRDVASEFKRLISNYGEIPDNIDDVELMNNYLQSSGFVGPILFVFDNFETILNPQEFYEWLDIYIRPPNKVLITTRHRDFDGDNQVRVGGMTKEECDALINLGARKLEIWHLLTESYRQEIYEESDGHPYVIKILLVDDHSNYEG